MLLLIKKFGKNGRGLILISHFAGSLENSHRFTATKKMHNEKIASSRW